MASGLLLLFYCQGGQLGIILNPVLWFSTCPFAVINMQSAQGHSQGKNHKMKAFLFPCPPPGPILPLSCAALPCPAPSCASAPALSVGHWHQPYGSEFFGRVSLNWATQRPTGFQARDWFALCLCQDTLEYLGRGVAALSDCDRLKFLTALLTAPVRCKREQSVARHALCLLWFRFVRM